MAIEIKELVIRANIDDSGKSARENAQLDYNELVSECVEEALRILAQKESR